MEQGALPAKRLASYRKLEPDLRHQAVHQDRRAPLAEKRSRESLQKRLNALYQERGR